MNQRVSDGEEIERPLWNVLRPDGDLVEIKATVQHGSVQVEDLEGLLEASINAHVDGVDVRVGGVQLVVKGPRVVLLVSHPPYPISRWTILWEGEIGSAQT